MYDCELNNGKTCRDFTCKEPCEFKSLHGICYDRCMKLRVCACCYHWKDFEKMDQSKHELQ